MNRSRRILAGLLLGMVVAFPASGVDVAADLARSRQAEAASPPNPNLALYFALRAANSGNPQAQLELGRLFQARGEPRQAVNWLIQALGGREYQAVHLLRKSPPAGDAEAWYQRGLDYDRGRGVHPDKRTALGWFFLAADRGHPRAHFEIGVMYENGRGVAIDHGEMMYFYQSAADLDDADGLYQLALYKSNQHSRGKAEEPDFDFAQYLFRKSARLKLEEAESGDSSAMMHVARLYLDGFKGLEFDEAAAERWFLKAAEAGRLAGYRYIAELCLETPSRGRTEAIKWYRKAAAKKDLIAIRALERMGEKP